MSRGASGSKYAATHLDQLLGGDRLDLVLCEFAMNDGTTYNNICEGTAVECAVRPNVVYSERLLRGLIGRFAPVVVFLDFPTFFVPETPSSTYQGIVDMHRRLAKHYSVEHWSLHDGLLALSYGEASPQSVWQAAAAAPGAIKRSHPPLRAHRLIAAYAARMLWRRLDQSTSWTMPAPLFGDPGRGSPSALWDFTKQADDRAPEGGRPASVQSWRGWSWSHEKGKFGLIAHANPEDPPSLEFRIAVRRWGFAVGYLRSYEHMGKTRIVVDGVPVRVLDGSWEDRSSQYDLAEFPLPTGNHTVTIIALRGSGGERGKSKVLDMLVY
jgi:hypothetical protein